ncbi:MAG: DUF3422 domain-containing protein [Rhodospirillales bacterium CG15_BIG_FIL_POST_REV_8_21_14_020_66_15]|nr:MAG: DUF3422 domain-containing protein [Rhodospirillales bacterium CG15_BIG_FIL_POST_REV_8_21_14_020_66_15]
MFKEHPLRRALAEEIHARPPADLAAPVQVSHIALISGEDGMAPHVAHLETLCKHFRVSPPAADATHFSTELGDLRLKWERHTEFSTFTILRPGAFAQPFKGTAIDGLPKDWLSDLPGQVIAACHVAVENTGGAGRAMAEIAGLFDNNPMTGSTVAGGKARFWTDYQLHADGFYRFLLDVDVISAPSLGRLVQRILEIETYRMMAMLAFPLARESRPRLAAVETRLGGIIARLGTREAVEDERQLLDDLSSLAAETEAVNVATAYRFAAARAYHELIRRRMASMREERLEGVLPAMDFLDRRFAPAMESCENLSTRLESLSGRIARATSLLRTRVDVALEAQNRDLLESMNRRARLQLRLQETVEGLSVVAISYYLLSLVSYLAKGAKTAGLSSVDPYVVVSAAFLPVVAGIWFGVRRMRRVIEKSTGGKPPADP